jgi:hypothetical protein
MTIVPTSELHIFEKNTDAIGVNRGFFFQVIKTMEKWLDSYNNKKKAKIYCETEDDIKSISAEGEVTYSQIKCYSSDFTLNSIEIKKTLFNSFSLHVKYKKSCKNFKFETNSSSMDETLTKWSKDNGLSDPLLFVECKKHAYSIILKEYQNQRDAKLSINNKKIETLNKKKPVTVKKQEATKQEIELLQEEIKLINDTYVLAQKILDEEIDNFIRKIEWEFSSVEPDKAIEEVEINCYARIKAIEEFKMIPKLAYGRLITEIYKRSKEQAIEERLLDDASLERIIKESHLELKNNSDQSIINHVTFEADKIIVKLDTVQDTLNLIKESKQSDEKSLSLDLKSEEEIEKHKTDELLKVNHYQSNLERKIKEINLEPTSEEVIIKYATELRCSYLLYLEELRLSGLTLEYDLLKKIEKEVRQECIMSVSTILEETNFNSADFWKRFADSLKQLISRHSDISGIKLDPSFVFAQMYQIAAECHLRWRKEVNIE